MFSSTSSFFVNQPISSATNHENTAFKARPNTSRESGSFSCSELFISTNHCTASPAFCPCTFSIFTKTPAISLFMDRFAWNSELKLLLASYFEPRGHSLVLFVRLFVCLLSWTQLNCSLVGFDFPSSSFLWSNERSFWRLFAISYRLYLSSCAAIYDWYLLQFVFSSPFFIEENDMCLSFKIWYSRILSNFCAAIDFSKKFKVFLPGNGVIFGTLNQSKQENFF